MLTTTINSERISLAMLFSRSRYMATKAGSCAANSMAAMVKRLSNLRLSMGVSVHGVKDTTDDDLGSMSKIEKSYLAVNCRIVSKC